MTSDVSRHVAGFRGPREFDRDFHPSAAADLQSETDEDGDRLQSDCDQQLPECPSDSEASDTAAEKKSSRHKLAKTKNDESSTTSADRER